MLASSSDEESSKPVRQPGVEPGRAKRTVGPVTPAQYKRPVTVQKPGAKISAAERLFLNALKNQNYK